MHPMAIVGIGCGAVLVIMVILGAFAFRWAKQSFDDLQAAMKEHPDRVLAQAVVEISPEVTLLTEDAPSGAVTLSVTGTGDTVTTTYTELANGDFRFTGADGAEHALGEGSPPPPAWVPAYPNIAESKLSLQVVTPGGTEGVIGFTTHDNAAMAKAFYAGECKWASSTSSSSQTFGSSSRFNVIYADGGKSLEIDGLQDGSGPLRIMVRYRD